MRARLALHVSGVAVELREIALRNKPDHMLCASPKGSVPVLILPDGSVIDESWEIMQWALRQHDPEGWLGEQETYLAAAASLINRNDTSFKYALDRYKYADRYPEFSRIDYRHLGVSFLQTLEDRLQVTRYLLSHKPTIADAAVFPFIRQFAEVDKDWFAHSAYPALRIWLTEIENSPGFAAVMQKQPIWQPT
jgi:glutathione S-transferase